MDIKFNVDEKEGVNMFIQGQDKNVIFTLSDKGFLKGQVYTKNIYINKKYWGSNIYGRNFFKKYLLGTYEGDEAEQVTSEIYALLKSGQEFYSMPNPSIELEDLGVSL